MTKHTNNTPKKPYQPTAKKPLNKRLEALIDCTNELGDMVGLVNFLEAAMIYDRENFILTEADLHGLKYILNRLTCDLSQIELTLTNEINLQRNAA